MLAKVKRNVRVTTPDGRIYDLTMGEEYSFHYRNDNAVVFVDQYGLEIIYSRNDFDDDFEISQI